MTPVAALRISCRAWGWGVGVLNRVSVATGLRRVSRVRVVGVAVAGYAETPIVPRTCTSGTYEASQGVSISFMGRSAAGPAWLGFSNVKLWSQQETKKKSKTQDRRGLLRGGHGI